MFIGRVLITGATGFVGRATVKLLLAAGYDVFQVTRDVDRAGANSNFVYMDLSKPGTVMNLVNHNRYDAIVHLGANIDLSNAGGDEMFLQNSLASGYLAYFAKKWDSYFVYASTAIVHGSRTEIINEDSPINLDTPYARTKWCAEEVIRASQVKHLILRIGGIYGLNGPNYLRLNNSIERSLKGMPPILQGSGVALRNYIYVEDVARAIVFAIKNQIHGVHLLAGMEQLSIKEMTYQLCEALIPGAEPILMEGGDPKNQVIKSSEIFPKSVKFKDALEDIKKKSLE